MKIIETQEQPKFKPVTAVFESAEELQYVTKMLSLGSDSFYRQFTHDNSTKVTPNYKMYSALCDACTKQGIEVSSTGTYIATY